MLLLDKEPLIYKVDKESLVDKVSLLFTLFSRWSMRIGFNRLATFMSKLTRSCAGNWIA